MTYVTREVLADNGVAHLEDDLSAGFPLCGTAYRPAREGTERRCLCKWCREAAGRERKQRAGGR